MSLTRRYFKSDITFSSTAAIALVIATMGLSGCKTSEVMNNGYIFDPQSLALAPVGSSREQVLLSLGTPSTTATFDGEVFYYISQKRTRAVAFMKPKLVDQNILAIYFDKTGVVKQEANYTLEDGKVFDTDRRSRHHLPAADPPGRCRRRRQRREELPQQPQPRPINRGAAQRKTREALRPAGFLYVFGLRSLIRPEWPTVAGRRYW